MKKCAIILLTFLLTIWNIIQRSYPPVCLFSCFTQVTYRPRVVVTVRDMFMRFPSYELRVQSGCRSNGFPWFTMVPSGFIQFRNIYQLVGITKAGSIDKWNFLPLKERLRNSVVSEGMYCRKLRDLFENTAQLL